ncbi:MAG: superoxide dismutase family protein [Paracoccus sp. (in: a-proteobacteria)]|nr:superoxide dismutase family protein [Paracoccus sp. (in: a-proteobacteria)]
MTPIRLTATAALILAGLGAAATAQDAPDTGPAPLVAHVAGPDGTPMGEVHATPTPSGVMHLTIRLTGLPEGTLGVHIHETGACAPDFGAAGGHLADGRPHGIGAEGGPHPGDLPNLHVPASGEITVEYFAPLLTRELMTDADGSAFIVHEHADDYATQPTGDAGGRLACGVFE